MRVITRAGVLLAEAFATLEDDVISDFPDCVIISYGVVEEGLRQTVRWVNNRTITNYYLNSVFDRRCVFGSAPARLTGLVLRVMNGAIRCVAVALGFRCHWMSVPWFLDVLERTIARVLGETSARVVVIGISPCSPRIEQRARGSSEAIAVANSVLAALCERAGERVTFVDPAGALGGAPLEGMVPDGIHFSAEGHRLVASALRPLLQPIVPFVGTGAVS